MSNTALDKQKRQAKLIVFLIVFLDLVGFGIFITLSTYLARHFQATEFQIGLLMASYSLMQFVFAPLWGRLSDKFGRRPILLLSLIGGSLSYLGIAFSDTLIMMFVCRSLAGTFAANISTAHAAIADVTDKKNRTNAMGLIGAAFGLGFIVGPSLGSLFGYIGQRLGDQAPFGIFFPALMAFVVTSLNLVWAYFALPETKGMREDDTTEEVSLQPTKTSALVIYLIGVFFLANLAMPLMEVMLFPFVKDRFGWGQVQSGIGFAVVGLVMAFTQGVLVRRMMPRWGERKMLVWGMILMGASFYMIAGAHTVEFLAVAMLVLAIGNGFVRPSLLGVVSVLSKETQQGQIMGFSQSAASMGRILGPVLGGWLYTNQGMTSPFIAAGVVTTFGFVAVLFKYTQLPDQKGPS